MEVTANRNNIKKTPQKLYLENFKTIFIWSDFDACNATWELKR